MVDPFRFAVGLRVIGGGKGDVVVKEASEFPCEGGGELGTPIRDDSFVEAETREDVLKKDLGDVRSGGGFVARAENYPLRKTVVYHDQNRIIAVGEGKVRDEIHRYLLEGAGAFRRDRGKWGVGRVGIDLIGLARGTAGDEFADEGGHAGPPVVFLEQGDSAEVSAVGAGKGFVKVFY